jgi:alpha-glucuronidase
LDSTGREPVATPLASTQTAWWRDACLLYFQTFSRRPWPSDSEAPSQSLDAYEKIIHHHVPGI